MTSKAADLAKHEADLAQADMDIAWGERRISAQTLRVEQLRLKGMDAQLNEQLLVDLQVQLERWRVHRELIIDRIAILKTS